MIKTFTLEDIGTKVTIKFVPSLDLQLTKELVFCYKDQKYVNKRFFSNAIINNQMYVYCYGGHIKNMLHSALKGFIGTSDGMHLYDDNKDNANFPKHYFRSKDNAIRFNIENDERYNTTNKELDNYFEKCTDLVSYESFNPFDYKCDKVLNFKIISEKEGFINFNHLRWSNAEPILKSEEDKPNILKLYEGVETLDSALEFYKNGLLKKDPILVFGEEAKKLAFLNYNEIR